MSCKAWAGYQKSTESMSTAKLAVVNSVNKICAHKIILGESSPLENWIAADRSLLQEEPSS